MAKALAERSLECLRRGEDALSPESKRAAYREGLDLARRAVAVDDRNADAHFALFANNGRILLLDDVSLNPLNLVKASAELERALELNPNHPDALAAKGGLYRQLPWFLGGDEAEAEKLLRRSIDLNPLAVSARIELAQIYRERGEPNRCVPLLEQAATIAEQQGKFRQLAEARALLRDVARTN